MVQYPELFTHFFKHGKVNCGGSLLLTFVEAVKSI